MIDQIHIPYRDRDDEFRLEQVYDDLAESVADPTERAVQQAIAGELFVEHLPATVGDALGLIERATPQARIALLNRGRAEAGLPSIESERMRKQSEEAASLPKHGPMRDGSGKVEAICGFEGCRNFEPGEYGLQIAWVDCKRWYCADHRAGHEAEMEPWQGPRVIPHPNGCGWLDLDEQDQERSRAEAELASAKAIREARLAEAAADVEALEPFEEAKQEADRRLNRHQFPWGEVA